MLRDTLDIVVKSNLYLLFLLSWYNTDWNGKETSIQLVCYLMWLKDKMQLMDDSSRSLQIISCMFLSGALKDCYPRSGVVGQMY